jgi:RAB protein geranylgeranyltransferase component A
VTSRPKLTDKDHLDRSLSRSGKKVLHVDRHDYYGGDDAGLSLQDVDKWVQDLDKGMALINSRSYDFAEILQVVAASSKMQQS